MRTIYASTGPPVWVSGCGGCQRRLARAWSSLTGSTGQPRPFDQLSAALAVALPFIAALLFLLAWGALSIADWTYLREQHYRDAHQAAASQARAYILAGRRASGELAAAA